MMTKLRIAAVIISLAATAEAIGAIALMHTRRATLIHNIEEASPRPVLIRSANDYLKSFPRALGGAVASFAAWGATGVLFVLRVR